MNKFHLALLLLPLISVQTYAGVSVVGTRFFIQDNKKISVKLMNDNESDYLIKSEIKGLNNSSNFIISPPLFIIKKNQTNIFSIIPNNIKFSHDEVFDLMVTAIPKTNKNNSNHVNLSVRSHFKLIYRYKPIDDSMLKLLEVKQLSHQENTFHNPTLSFLTVYISCDINNQKQDRLNVAPNQTLSIPKCTNDTWVSLVRDDGSVSSMQKLNVA